jgi:hypothetical protein
MATVFLDEEVVTLVNFLRRRTTVNFDCYTQTLRSLNAHVCQACLTKTARSVAFP